MIVFLVFPRISVLGVIEPDFTDTLVMPSDLPSFEKVSIVPEPVMTPVFEIVIGTVQNVDIPVLEE
jgi:hypothetical protein